MQITEYSETEAGLARLRERMEGVVYDVTIAAGMDLAKKDRRELVGLRTSLETKRKEIKAPALERCKMIDEEAKRVTGEILALETPIDQQIKAEEARREEERQEKLRQAAAVQKILDDKIIEIGKLPLYCIGKTSTEIADFLAKIKEKEIGGEFQGETRKRAEAAKDTAIAEIITALGNTIEEEAKAEALKAEQEAEAARQEAERVERERLMAVQRAEIERQQAELMEQKRRNDLEIARLKELADAERAKFEAERAAFEKEQKAVDLAIKQKQEAEAAELKRQQDEEDAKRRDEERKAAILAEQKRVEAEKERKAAEKARKLAEAKCKDASTAFQKILVICNSHELSGEEVRSQVALIAEANI